MEAWQEGKILINKAEFMSAKIKLIAEEEYSQQNAEYVTRLGCIHAQEMVDFAINKMMETV